MTTTNEKQTLWKMLDDSDGSLYNAMQYAKEKELITAKQMEILELAFDDIVSIKHSVEDEK